MSNTENLTSYFVDLAKATVDDYTLITLAAFGTSLGAAKRSPAVGLATFFGGYFALRLVNNVGEVIGYHARNTLVGNRFVAEAIKSKQVIEGEMTP